jgi:L-seryl-tRNA(Ser) seleniumtransferase
VGTTNRTKLRDYETALSEETAMILRVHPSNFRIVGFTEAPDLTDLAELAKRAGAILFEDAGSGALVDLSEFGLTEEPVINRSIADGADLVSFSADKLMGGPQAGIIVGRRDLIEKIRSHPLYRALRVDKIAYAALEATLRSYLTDRHFEEVPTLKMLFAPANEIRERSELVVESITSKAGEALRLEIIDGESVIGGGSAPDVKPATALISATIRGLKAEELESRLRGNDPPVIARIAGDKVLIDLRTVRPDEESELVEAVAAVSA